MSTIGDTLLAKGDAISVFCTRDIEDITSTASIVDPSWNVTPECKLNVYVKPSELTSHDFARPGTTLKSLSIFVKPSYILFWTIITELNAVGKVFSEYKPKISSTKSLAGHSLGATSVHEAIYSLIMMKNSFIAASANITDMDDEAKKYPIVTKVEKDVNLNSVMSNSFGFGGTNATLVFEKV